MDVTPSTAGTVFVATDLSETANEAIRQGHARAHATGARLVVCHIVPNLVRVNMLFPQETLSQANAESELHAKAMHVLVERTCTLTGRAPEGFKAIVDEGVPYAGIVDHAERHRAALIVISDRGTTGLSRLLLGSVADRVIRYAHAPVLVARAGKASGKVVVATDFSDPSMPAIEAAAAESRRPGVTVTALHCVEPVGVVSGPEYGTLGPGVTVGVLKEARNQADKLLAEALTRFELKAETRVLEGTAASSIVSAADELGAELIILGTRGKTGVRRVLLGSVAEAVVRHAGCSVLVVRLHEDG